LPQRSLVNRLASGWPAVVSDAVLLAWFGGFFVYSGAVIAGAPASLGGFTGLAATAAVVPLAIAFAGTLRRQRPHKVEYFVWLFIFFISLAFIWIGDIQTDPRNIAEYRNGFIIWLAMFLLGRSIDLSRRSTRAILLFVAATGVLIIFVSSQQGTLRFSNSTVRLTYQSVAAYLYVPAIVSVALFRGWSAGFLFALFGVCFYVNGARAEFIAYLTFGLVYLVISRGGVAKSAALFFVILLGLTSVPVLDAVFDFLSGFSGNRINDLIFNRAEGSISLRRIASVQAWQTVMQHPLTGAFGHYRPGNYAHNILSAWVDLGITGLFLFLAMLGSALFASFKRFFQHPESLIARLTVSGFLPVIGVVLFAQQYLYVLFALVLGLALRSLSGPRPRRSPR
jgi:hypothetical protein